MALLVAGSLGCATVPSTERYGEQERLAIASPAEALAELKAGNDRFVSGQPLGHDYLVQVDATAGGQKPFAVVLGCIDSRVPPEIVFDQGIGDIFSPRIAGNFENGDILGSMEFATAVAGAKLIVVLGHTGCGAIKGAADRAELGNLTAMLEELMPAVEAVPAEYGERSSANTPFVTRATELNVTQTIADIQARSPVLAEMVDKGSLAIVGAVYDVSSGEVRFLD